VLGEVGRRAVPTLVADRLDQVDHADPPAGGGADRRYLLRLTGTWPTSE
jgi:hypothetical protein